MQLTSSWKGLVANARDRPRDMFTASGGTEGTDIYMVTLGDGRDCVRTGQGMDRNLKQGDMEV